MPCSALSRCPSLALPGMPRLSSFLHLAWPVYGRVLAVFVLYAVYLPFSGYEPRHIFYDAGEYWDLSLQFFRGGKLDFLGFQGAGRGYVGPLLLLPGRVLCRLTGCSILAASRVLGAGWAALLFGAVLPAAWQRVKSRALENGRWLALTGLGFALWRDHFNFPLTDFPGFTLSLLGLLLLARPRPMWWLGAGLALAAVVNMRPLYAAAVPAWLGLAFYLTKNARYPGKPGLACWLALALGAALVMGPQVLLNWRHEGRATPLVLVAAHDAHRDYLHVLSWGTRLQRYETGFFPGAHRVLMVPDSTGIRQISRLGPGGFASYAEYFAYVGRCPASVAQRYLRHLFNGLDLWYPTPYPRQVHPPGQAAGQVLNFAALGLGLLHVLAIVRGRVRTKKRIVTGVELLVGAALLLPVLAALASQTEPRYFLPLHLLVLLLAVTARPLRWAGLQPRIRPGRVVLALLLAALWVGGCWRLSRATQRLAEFDRFDLMQ